MTKSFVQPDYRSDSASAYPLNIDVAPATPPPRARTAKGV